jgi:hypothetical protein
MNPDRNCRVCGMGTLRDVGEAYIERYPISQSDNEFATMIVVDFKCDCCGITGSRKLPEEE